MSRFPPGSIRDRVARFGDYWMTNGGLMPLGRHLSDKVADEMAIEYAMRCTNWPNTTFDQREKYRRSSFVDRAFMGFPVTPR